MKYLFLDTNIFLHYQSFEDIPWKQVIGISEDISIVICETVIAEIDKHKDSQRGKLRDRAKKVSKRISEIFLEGRSTKIPVVMQPYQQPSDVLSSKYDTTVCDNRILISALISSYPEQDIIMISADNNLLIKAKQSGLSFFRMGEEYKLTSEPTEEEKENKALRDKLSRYENRMPKPVLLFEETNSDTLLINRPLPIDIDKEVEESVFKEMSRYPEDKSPEEYTFDNYIPNEIAKMMNQLQRHFPYHSPEQVAYYNKKRKEYLDAFKERKKLLLQKKELENNFIPLQFCVSNQGTSQTGNMLIRLGFPEDLFLYTSNSKKTVSHKELAVPSHNQLETILNNEIYFNPHYRAKNEVMMFDDEAYIEKHSFSFQYAGLIHGTTHSLNTDLYIDIRQVSEFDINWEIADSELIEHVTGTLKVKIRGTIAKKQEHYIRL